MYTGTSLLIYLFYISSTLICTCVVPTFAWCTCTLEVLSPFLTTCAISHARSIKVVWKTVTYFNKSYLVPTHTKHTYFSSFLYKWNKKSLDLRMTFYFLKTVQCNPSSDSQQIIILPLIYDHFSSTTTLSVLNIQQYYIRNIVNMKHNQLCVYPSTFATLAEPTSYISTSLFPTAPILTSLLDSSVSSLSWASVSVIPSLLLSCPLWVETSTF